MTGLLTLWAERRGCKEVFRRQLELEGGRVGEAWLTHRLQLGLGGQGVGGAQEQGDPALGCVHGCADAPAKGDSTSHEALSAGQREPVYLHHSFQKQLVHHQRAQSGRRSPET